MKGLTDAEARHLRGIVQASDFEPTPEYLETEEMLALHGRVRRQVLYEDEVRITWTVEDTQLGRLALALYDAGIR